MPEVDWENLPEYTCCQSVSPALTMFLTNGGNAPPAHACRSRPFLHTVALDGKVLRSCACSQGSPLPCDFSIRYSALMSAMVILLQCTASSFDTLRQLYQTTCPLHVREQERGDTWILSTLRQHSTDSSDT